MAATRVKFVTTMGDVTLELEDEKAPATVANFLQYVDSDFYTGTIFHRVINGFMIQGGGLDAEMNTKPTRDPIKNEADNGLANLHATVAMARTNDPHSATAQFFINVKDNHFLDHTNPSPDGWGYCVFGRVIDGMDTVNAIKAVSTGSSGPMSDVPVDTIEITGAKAERE
ncbi:MAG: peptidylprolyl isomerase [Gammaproteobacteria bacterium]